MENRTSYSLGHLSDQELVASLARVTGSHRALTAELVAHLAEMDSRKLYASHACGSLFAYCVERLGFSEDEACRRIEAARLAQKFPGIYARIERAEVSLSVLGRLKPFLTDDNAVDLLDAVRGKTVRETERILAAKFPKPDTPDSIRKLPERKASPNPITPEPMLEPMAVPVPTPTPAPASMPAPPPALKLQPAPRTPDRGKLKPLSAERIQVKFTASAELERKLELARDLMSHSNPRGDLATVIEAALDLLIADRLKKKLGKTKQPRKPRPSKRTRVTNATRREVVDRDGLRCSFVDANGQRCSSRAFLELDHERPKAKGAGSEAANVRLLCRGHNQAEAERVFGKEFIEQKKSESRSKRGLTVRDGGRGVYQAGFSAGRAEPPAMSREESPMLGNPQVTSRAGEPPAMSREEFPMLGNPQVTSRAGEPPAMSRCRG